MLRATLRTSLSALLNPALTITLTQNALCKVASGIRRCRARFSNRLSANDSFGIGRSTEPLEKSRKRTTFRAGWCCFVDCFFPLGFMTFALLLFSSIEAMARVGGGQGYGGGGGDDDGGAIAWVVIELIRFLVYLTIEYPIVGIPLDIIVVCAVIYYFVRKGRKGPTTFTSASTSTTLGLARPANQRSVAASFEQLRRFDPNFSEIVFTDFAYTLYAKAHHARWAWSQRSWINSRRI